MAVEARHLDLPRFHPRFLPSRELMNPVQGNGGMYNDNQIGLFGLPLPDTQIPMFSSVNGNINVAAGSSFVPQVVNPAIHSFDSAVTSNVNNNDLLLIPFSSRKRTREEESTTTSPLISQASYGQHQQIEIDRLISHHMEIVKMKIEETRDREERRITEAMEHIVMKRLRAKEEEIEKIVKLNYALEERVKSLCVENQIWRNVAQSNEATANALRNNLEAFLAADGERTRDNNGAVDAESSCGSNDRGENGEEEDEEEKIGKTRDCRRMCKMCGMGESSVLLLPCRHLCVCTRCGSKLHVCPICKAVKNATVNVNTPF